MTIFWGNSFSSFPHMAIFGRNSFLLLSCVDSFEWNKWHTLTSVAVVWKKTFCCQVYVKRTYLHVMMRYETDENLSGNSTAKHFHVILTKMFLQCNQSFLLLFLLSFFFSVGRGLSLLFRFQHTHTRTTIQMHKSLWMPRTKKMLLEIEMGMHSTREKFSVWDKLISAFCDSWNV